MFKQRGLRRRSLVLISASFLLLAACSEDDNNSPVSAETQNTQTAADTDKKSAPQQSSSTDLASPAQNVTYQMIDWVDLMPKEDFDALSNPPAYLDDIEDGSPEDQLSNQMLNALESSTDSKYQQALSSVNIVKAYDGKNIRLPGFIVPLEFNAQHEVTEFFIVPYFGACIHVPPPPPNQIIYAQYPEGFAQEALQEAFWLTGKLSTQLTENDLGTSAYTLNVDKVEKYTDY